MNFPFYVVSDWITQDIIKSEMFWTVITAINHISYQHLFFTQNVTQQQQLDAIWLTAIKYVCKKDIVFADFK